jgi:hypothetical protein
MDISTLTLTELKALAYDQIMLIQQSQNNLNLIQAEIEKRKQATGGEDNEVTKGE